MEEEVGKKISAYLSHKYVNEGLFNMNDICKQ